MRSVVSIKDRLKNRSRETGRTLQELFTVYGLERTIKLFLLPAVESIRAGEKFRKVWNSKDQAWSQKLSGYSVSQ